MRRERRQRPFLRGLLLFVLGALVGTNATYFVMTRDAGPRAATQSGERIETALPMQPATEAGASTVEPAPTAPMLPPPAVRATGVGPAALPANDGAASRTGDGLLVPVQGIPAAQLQDTFTDARSGGRVHDAIDIMAPHGTPVVAAAPGTVEKLFESEAGGITAYLRSDDRRWIYYYAHLQGYAPGLAEGQHLVRGTPLGQVGSTGNADAAGPHLHFAINRMAANEPWHGGRPINPYPLLAAGAPAR